MTAQLIGVPKETYPGERRVATVPDVVPKLAKLGFSVIVQSGAGDAASIGDDAYLASGATIAPDAATVWSRAGIVFKVRAPSADELDALRKVWLDNEVLYREGLALQVDRGDVAIRERVIFKALSVVDAGTKLPRIGT